MAIHRPNPSFADPAAGARASASAASTRGITEYLPAHKLEAAVLDWADAALKEAEQQSAARPVNKILPRIQAYLAGNQWPSRLTAYGASRPVSNRMFRQYWELVSLLTDGKPEPEIKLYNKIDGYSELEEVLYTALSLWGRHPRFKDALQDIVGWGLLGRAIAKVQWNKQLAGGMGDVELLPISPQDFHTLGGDGSILSAELCIETRIVTIASLVRRFGKLAYGMEPDVLPGAQLMTSAKPGAMSRAEWSKLGSQMKRIIGDRRTDGNDQTYPMVRERLYWMLDPAINETNEDILVGNKGANWSYTVKPGQPLFPRGRVLTVAGGRVLEDKCNPYFHGQHPYVEYVPLRPAWMPEGHSLMSNLLGPQDIVNRINAGLLETVKAALIPTIVSPTGAVSTADMNNISTTISGGKLEYNPRFGQPPQFRKAPEIPTLSLNVLQLTMREMDQMSGSAAIDAAAQKEQIPSHDTMELIQSSRSSLVRLMGRGLERFLERAGHMVVSNMLQFYSVGHRVALMGVKGITSMDFTPLYGSLLNNSMAPEEYVRRVQFAIREGSSMTFDKETRVQMAMLLQEKGLLSHQNLFRVLDSGINVKQNDDELLGEAMQKLGLAGLAAQAANAGKPQPQPGAGGGAAPGGG